MMIYEDCTLSELVGVYQQRTEQAYKDYTQAVKGPDETAKDESYKKWAHADDCLMNLKRVIEMVQSDIV